MFQFVLKSWGKYIISLHLNFSLFSFFPKDLIFSALTELKWIWRKEFLSFLILSPLLVEIVYRDVKKNFKHL